MQRLLVFTLVLCSLFSACKKKDSEVAPPPTGTNQVPLKTIVYQNLPSPYYQFQYDANGRVNMAAFASGAFNL
jgi:hypothetical protein